MLVATFGPATGWVGREITWQGDRFILAGHGPVPAAGVLDYDRLGQLVWARPELRPWVVSVAQWEGRSRVASNGSAGPYAGDLTTAASATSPGRRRLPAWAIILILVAVLLVVAAAVLGAIIPMIIVRTTETLTRDAAVRAGARTIQVGLEAYAVDNDGTYPPADDVDAVGLSRYISEWPENPYTDLPMSDGGGPGNFVYTRSADGGAYRLTGFGRDGGRVIYLWGGDGAQMY
jgi:hypothetical protein